jgi:hypothetical protein
VIATLAATLFAACGGEPTRAPDAGTGLAHAALASDAGPPWADEAAKRLATPDETARTAAIAEIGAVAIRRGITPEDARTLLTAIAKLPEDAQRTAVDAVFLQNRPELVTPLDEAVPNLAAPGRAQAAAALARTGDPTAIASLLRLLSSHRDEPQPLAFVELRRRRPAGVFPELLALAAAPVFADDIVATARAYCASGAARPKVLGVHADALLARWHALAGDPLKVDEAAATLALLGCLPRRTVEKELRAATELTEPRLVLAAIRGLVLVGARPPKPALEAIAANPATRARLYDFLVAAGKKRLFPKAWRDQARLAEALLVEWLADRDHLGRPPDEIELLDVVAVDLKKPVGLLDHYVFRFRIESGPYAKKGWMLGVAGPFRRKKTPTLDDHGGTHSDLKSEGRRDAEDVVKERDVREQWAADAEELPTRD